MKFGKYLKEAKNQKKILQDLKKNIGDTIEYGSPGYPMDFLIKKVSKDKTGDFEIEGEINGEDGHFFFITIDTAEEFLKTGEAHWTSRDGGYSHMKLI